MDLERLALVLLAAGASRRFGGDKLSAPLRGRPLAHHAGETLARLRFRARIAVVAHDDFGLGGLGYEIARPTLPSPPISASIAVGVAAARRHEPDAIMIALGDMPFVSTDHFLRLAKAFGGDRIASTHAVAPTPPVIFGARWFDRLGALSGDAGAQSLLEGAPMILADARTLLDIDTPGDLRAADASFCPIAGDPADGR